MKKIIVLLLFSTFVMLAKPQFEMDYNIFYVGEGFFNVEICYSFPSSNYNLSDSVSQLQWMLKVDSSGKEIVSDVWLTEIRPGNEDFTTTQSTMIYYGIRNLSLTKGHYSAKLSLCNTRNTSDNKEMKFEIIVPDPILPNQLAISSLQIANNIMVSNSAVTEKLTFFKNQYLVYPNPQRLIDNDSPMLQIYFEIYNSYSLSPDGIDLRYEIINNRGMIVDSFTRHKSAVADAVVDVTKIPLDLVPSGVYKIRILAMGAKDTAKAENAFYLVNAAIQDEGIIYTDDQFFEMSEFAVLTAERVDIEYAIYSAIATSDENKTWGKLSDLKAKQRFLYRFWYERNPDKDNSYNAKLAEFRERLKYVNTYFSYLGKDNGWQSDRGKMYLKYGAPDERDQYPSDPEKRAYEIWTYNSIEGGGKFYFADLVGLENFKLIHSTISGYVQNANWYNLVSKQYQQSE